MRLVAPSALRRPISRVRSRTAISMMFMTPMPPSTSVMRLTPRKKFFMLCIILLNITDSIAVFQSESASLSSGSNPFDRRKHSA